VAAVRRSRRGPWGCVLIGRSGKAVIGVGMGQDMAVTDLPTDVPADVRHTWTELAEQVRGHQFLYHVKDAPTISDGEYDALIRQLNALEDRFGELRTRTAPPAGRRCLLHGLRLG